jgi:hypothetical protein
MTVQFAVVDPVISGRQVARIFRWDGHYDSRNHPQTDIGPRPVVDVGLEPVAAIIAVPAAAIEIHAKPVGNHVDVAFAAGNHDHIRRCGKTDRRGHTDIDADAYILCRCRRGAKQGKKRND